MKLIVVISLLVLSASSYASTGPAGFAVGFSEGMTGIDFSDGTNRYNIGGVTTNLTMGIHIQDFAFLLDGSFTDFKSSLTDYLADGGFRIKWYFTENWHLSYIMGLSRFQTTTLSGQFTTFTAYGGGYAGGILGWDLVGEGNNPLRVSINAGVKRYDFGAVNSSTGQSSSSMDLNPHLTGVGFFGILNLIWYL